MISDRLKLNNNSNEIERFYQWISSYFSRTSLPNPVTYAIEMALEELILNSMSHGKRNSQESDDNPGEIEIYIQFDPEEASREVTITVSDDCEPFNPLAAEQADTETALEQRQIGGLGIHLTRKQMDTIEYRRESNKNIMIMKKKIGE